MRTVLIASIAGTFLWASGGARADEARDLVAKAIKAHGGEEALAKYKAGQTKGKGKLDVAGMTIDIAQEASYMLPDKSKEIVDFEINGTKVRVVSIINGDKYSIVANDMDVPISDNIKAALEEGVYAMKASRMTTLLKDKAFELSSLGEVKVNDKPALGVRVASKGQKDISLYFDKATGLLAKMERRATDPMSGNEITEERVILEYQKKEGMAVPKKVVVNHDGKKYLELEIEEIKLLEKLDESEFAK